MPRARGLTVVECLLALTILSATVLATCYTLAAGQQHVYHGDRISTAVRLGRDLLEEITSRNYRDERPAPGFGKEAGEALRTEFDDVDDYHGLVEAPGSLVDSAGAAYAAADQTYRRSVTVAAATETIADLGRSFTGLKVTVTVKAASGEQWQFSRFIPEPGK